MPVQNLSFKNKNKVYQQHVKNLWRKLEKWIDVKQIKVVLIFEGEANKTQIKLAKLLKKWSKKRKSSKFYFC